MNCPRCNIDLQTNIIKEFNKSIEVDICPDCSGIWFDKGELAKLDKIVEPTFIEIRKIPAKKDQFEKLSCPSCSKTMLKSDHPRDSKVIMDYCAVCQGIWLDKGELDAIQKENWIMTASILFKWMIGKD
jgi:uncharacterized protein